MAQPGVEKISEDADAFFLGRRQDPAFLQTRWGFLIQGTALVGKTRFVGEWIRRHLPGAFVLVPDSTMPPPEIPAGLRWKRQVCLLLDDLDEFRDHAIAWGNWVERLRKGKGSILVWATVRDSGPGFEVQENPAFRRMRENLEHVVLAPLSPEQQEEVGRRTGHLVAPKGDREPTFAWLLKQEFDEAGRRYETRLGVADRTLLQAAALLERCLIPIRLDLWLRVARQVFGFSEEPSAANEALHSLRQHGFLLRGIPEPAYLRHVVELIGFNDLIVALGAKGIQSAVFTYNRLISQAPDYETAKEWFDKMVEARVQPDVVTYTTLIAQAPGYETAKGWFDKMVKAGVQPDVVTYGKLFSKDLSSTKAKAILDWYLNQSYHPADPLQAAISGFLKIHRLDDALYLSLNYPYLEASSPDYSPTKKMRQICSQSALTGAIHTFMHMLSGDVVIPFAFVIALMNNPG